MRQRYVFTVDGETEQGVETACVVADNETDAALFVRNTLGFVLVNRIQKDAIAWVS